MEEGGVRCHSNYYELYNVCSVLFYALCRFVPQLNCFSKAVSQSYNVPADAVMI